MWHSADVLIHSSQIFFVILTFAFYNEAMFLFHISDEHEHEKWHVSEKCIEDCSKRLRSLQTDKHFFSRTLCLGILEQITYSIASPVLCPAVWLHFLFPSYMSTIPLSSQDRQTSRFQQGNCWTERSLINRSCLTSQQTLWPRIKYMTSDLRCWKNFIPRWVMGHSNLRSWIVRVGIVCVKMNTKEKQLINKASDIRDLLSFAMLWLTYWNLALIRAFLSRNNERNAASYKR